MRDSRQTSIGRCTRAFTTGALGVALGATLLAACSSSPKSSSPPASNTPGVTATSINIGATVPLTGPAAPGYDEIAPAMNAVFDWANAHGGVDGRKIHYTYLDDGYNPANTATLTRKLVLQDNIFADIGSLGTPTQTAVQQFLNSQKVPQLFIESGCNCWSDPTYPYSSGWQPPYTVEGKILGNYVKTAFAGKKIGYLYQGDEFGQDLVKGLDMEIPAKSVVSRQTYDAATLAGPLSNQIAALKAAGAQVVVMATIPAATALAMLPGAAIGYIPQYVLSNVGRRLPHGRAAAVVVHPERWRVRRRGEGGHRPVERGHHRRLLRARVEHVQSLGAGGEEAVAGLRAQPVREVGARRQHPVRHRPGLHVRPGPPGGREEPHPGQPVGRHRQVREELRHPRIRAPCRTRAACTTASRAPR